MVETAEEIQELLRLEKVAADKEGRAIRLGPEIPEPDIEPAPSPKALKLATTIGLRPLGIPADAVTVETGASGRPTVVESRGEKFFKPGSTPFRQGFRTESERIKAQQVGAVQGIHEGDLIKEGSIILTTKAGKPIARFTKKQVEERKVDIQDRIDVGQFVVPVKGPKGKTILLLPAEVEKLNSKTGEDKFKFAVKIGLVPKGAKFIDTGGKGIQFIPKFAATQAERLRIKAVNSEIAKQNRIIEAQNRQIATLNTKADQTRTVLNKSHADIKPREKTNLATNIFRFLTPWREEAGETFLTHAKSWPKRTLATFNQNISGPTGNQTELKKQFDDYAASPNWLKALSDQPVILDKGSGQYLQLAIGYGPAVGPKKGVVDKGRKLVQTLGPKEAGMSESAFKVFVRARGKTPNLTPAQHKINEAAKTKFNWKQITEIARKKRIKDKRSLLRSVNIKASAKAKLEASHKIRPSTAKARELKRLNREARRLGHKINEAIKPVPAVSPKTIPVAITSTATLELTKLKTQTAAQAATRLQQSHATATLLATSPQTLTEILSQVSPQTATELLNQTETDIKTLPLTQTQQKTLTETLTQVQTLTETQTAQETATQTKTEAQQKVKTQTVSVPQSPTAPKGKTPGKPKAPEKTGKPTRERVPSPTIRIPKPKQEKANRRQIKAAKGAIAFRTGQLNNKDVWRVIMWPYRQVDMVTVLGRTPQGAVAVRGPESARRTAIKIGRAPSKKLQIDMGFQDVTVTPLGEKRIGLDFKPDPKLETKLPLTVTGTGKAFPLEDK